MRALRRFTRAGIVLPVLAALLLCGLSAPAGAQERGFDGTTVKIAGYGIKESLPGAEFGAKARVDEFNTSNEIPGVKIEFSEFVDDKQDPATALSEVRRLVT